MADVWSSCKAAVGNDIAALHELGDRHAFGLYFAQIAQIALQPTGMDGLDTTTFAHLGAAWVLQKNLSQYGSRFLLWVWSAKLVAR